MEIITKSAQETESYGKQFADSLKAMPAGRQGAKVLALIGGLGSGKTTFVQGLAKGLGITKQVISPTFVLMREYKIDDKWPMLNAKYLYHIDLYRLDKDIDKEIGNLGLNDLWGKEKNIVVIEWADKARNVIPSEAVWIIFEQIDEATRKIRVNWRLVN